MASCRDKISRLLRTCAGAAAVGFVATAALAQNSSPATKEAGNAAFEAAEFARKVSDGRFVFDVDRPASVVNRGSPPVGGGCQVANLANGFNYGRLFHVADNFNPSVSGQLTAVSWSAVYAAGTANGTPPATETFTIRILADNAGVPGAPVPGGVLTVNNPTRANSGQLLGALQVLDYTAAGLNGPNLTAGTCYWLEIQNTSTLVAPTNATFWVTAVAIPGDTVSYVDSTPDSLDTECNGYEVADQSVGDLTFCVNLALNTLDGLNCPIASPGPACTNPGTNGTGLASSSGVGFVSVSPGSVFPGTVTGNFQRAENFSVTTAGNLQSVCFWGFFAGTGLAADSCARNFDIIVWNNNNANGQPGTVRGQVTVGTTPGVTLTRTIDAGGNEVFQVNLGVANQIPLTANTCFHLTVSNFFDTNDPGRSARFVWGSTPATVTPGGPIDNRFFSRTITSGSTTAGAWQLTNSATDNRFNLSYLLNVGPAGAPNCTPPAPGNDTCATATPLPLNTPVNGTNVNGNSDALPGCAFDIVEGSAVWFTFTGTGNDTTVSTCNTGSLLDSIIHVYCAPNGCAGPFNCVAGNDDADPACGTNAFASTATFGTTPGTTYFVVVAGFGGSEDTFIITRTEGAPSVGVEPCASLARCDLNAAPFDVRETDNCGVDAADTNSSCATASIYPNLGDTAAGSISADGGTRDLDFWRLPGAASGATVAIAIQAENPILFQLLNDPDNDCATANTVIPDTTLAILACVDLDIDLIEITLPAGTNYFVITAPSFDGSTCSLGLDEYRFEIRAASVGACCLDSTVCFQTTFTDCAAQSAGSPNDFFAPDVACSPDPCISQPGNCCFPDSTCQLVPSQAVANSTECANAGGTYTAGAVCEPNPCAAPGGACCQGATCVASSAGACTGPNTVFAGNGTVCNVFGVNNTTPCCLADFNHVGGVTVQDIFDFLGAYFSQNPFANINGQGGVTVQDIFDFLGAYFAGC